MQPRQTGMDRSAVCEDAVIAQEQIGKMRRESQAEPMESSQRASSSYHRRANTQPVASDLLKIAVLCAP